MKSLFLTLLFTAALIVSEAQDKTHSHCATKAQADTKMEDQQLAVISLKITKSEDQYAVALTNATFLNSDKNVSETVTNWNEDDFLCFILDDQKNILDTLLIKQPLKMRYEYPQNDEKTIGSKTVELTENEMLLRFPYETKMKYLRIAKVEAEALLRTIDTLELPE